MSMADWSNDVSEHLLVSSCLAAEKEHAKMKDHGVSSNESLENNDPAQRQKKEKETEESSEGDTENEEVTVKKKAIAEAELEVSNLQKEINDTNDTRSDVNRYETLLEKQDKEQQRKLDELNKFNYADSHVKEKKEKEAVFDLTESPMMIDEHEFGNH